MLFSAEPGQLGSWPLSWRWRVNEGNHITDGRAAGGRQRRSHCRWLLYIYFFLNLLCRSFSPFSQDKPSPLIVAHRHHLESYVRMRCLRLVSDRPQTPYDKNITGEGVTYHSDHAKLTTPNNIEIHRQDGTMYNIVTDKVVIGMVGIPSSRRMSRYLACPSASTRMCSSRARIIPSMSWSLVHDTSQSNSQACCTCWAQRPILLRATTKSSARSTLPTECALAVDPTCGINFHGNSDFFKRGGPLMVHFNTGKSIEVDTVLSAIGRKANTENFGLEDIGVKLDPKGNAVADEWPSLLSFFRPLSFTIPSLCT